MNNAFSNYTLTVEKPHKGHDRWEIADMTAKLIQRPTKQVLGMTRKWSVSKLRERYLQCEKCADPCHEWFKLRWYDKQPVS